MQQVRSRHTDAATKFNAQAAPAIGNEVSQSDVERLEQKINQIASTQKQVVSQVLRHAKDGDDAQVQIRSLQDQVQRQHSEIRMLKDARRNEQPDHVATAMVAIGSSALVFLSLFSVFTQGGKVTVRPQSFNQEQIR